MPTSTRQRNNTLQQGHQKTADALYESAAQICDPGSRPRQWKRNAKKLLGVCTASTIRLPKVHALLAYVHFVSGDAAAAEASLRSALRLDPKNRVYLRFMLTILLAQGKDTVAARWLRKLANLEGVDLPGLKNDLRIANLPTDTSTLVLNAFPNGLDWFESHLSDEVEWIRLQARDRAAVDSELEQEINQLRPRKIDARRVPRDLRRLIPVALQWGIGDDAARGALVRRASQRQRRQLRSVLPVSMRRRINEWLDRFSDGAAMTDEAACFMYTLLAYEESTNQSSD